MFNRLTQNFSLDKSGTFIFIYGNVTDQFISDDLTIHSLDRYLWLYLKKNNYQRVVFFDSSKRMRYFDKESFSLRKGTKNIAKGSTTRVGTNYKSRLKGVLGNKKKYLTTKTTSNDNQEDSSRQGRSAGIDLKTNLSSTANNNIFQVSLSDESAIERIDHQMRDNKIKTAIVFSQIDQHYFRSDNARNELRNRIKDWNTLDNSNKMFFIFQSPEIVRTVNEQKVWVPFLDHFPILRNIIQTNTVNEIEITTPSASELSNLINHERLINKAEIDWFNHARILKAIRNEEKQLKKWRDDFKRLKNNNKNTLSYAALLANNLVQETYTDEEEQILDETLLDKNLAIIKSQDDNTNIIGQAIKGFFYKKKKDKPLVLFLVGTSGTGKTFTVKQVHKSLLRNGYRFVYLPMPEFQQEHTVSKIIGSPPGYAGNSEPPLLLQELKKSKKLVICFDEIEKAHPDILTALMQLLEEGKMTFNVGGKTIKAEFNECILFFTSNAEMLKLLKLKNQYRSNGIQSKDIQFQKKVAQTLIDAKVIRNEETGRINQFLVYNPLTSKAVIEVTLQELNNLQEGINFVDTPPKLLAEVAFEVSGSLTGARDIKKILNSMFSEQISQLSEGDYHIEFDKEIGRYLVKSHNEGIYAAFNPRIEDAIKLYEKLEREARLIDFDAVRKYLLDNIKNQDDNIEQISAKFKEWYPIIEKDSPLSFFLVGTSGTGKTYTAKKLTAVIKAFGYSEELIVFDMNNFKSVDDRNRLIGSPTGFVGSEQKPRIFEALDNSPKGKLVILFDEIEKAHPEILTSLMQLLDEGILEWSKGIGDFRKCIIFFTSNAMMDELVALKQSWIKKKEAIKTRAFENKIKQILVENRIIRTEVTGRISKFLIYNPLGLRYTVEIAYKEVNELVKKYGLTGVRYISPNILADIAKTTAGKATGTREVKDYIKELLGELIVDYIRAHPTEKDVISIIDEQYENGK